MIADFPSLFYYLLLMLTGITFFTAVLSNTPAKTKHLKWLRRLTTTISGAVMGTLVYNEQRLPIFGAFEAAIYLVFIMCLLEATTNNKNIPQNKAEALLPGGPSLQPTTTLSRTMKQNTGAISPQPAPFRQRPWEKWRYLPETVKTAALTSGFLCVLLLVNINCTKAFNPDFFMYANPWVNLFFNLRLTATAFFCQATLHYLAGAWMTPKSAISPISAKKHTDAPAQMKKSASVVDISPFHSIQKKETPPRNHREFYYNKARYFLLGGLVIFLCSEWAGSWWCLNWLGDSWHWSKGFFKAAVVFMLVMLTCHLPPFLSRNNGYRIITGSLPAFYLLWMIFNH